MPICSYLSAITWKLKKAFNVSGYKITPVDNMYAYYMYHIAEIMLYSVMSKTILGKLMVSDHCENGIQEMKYLDKQFEEYRKEHPGRQMSTWDEMRKWALPAFENADEYAPQNTNEAKNNVYQ